MIKDLYQASMKSPEYGVQGYYVAKTCNYSTRESKFPISKRKDLTYEAQCHSKEPDPTKYNESYEKTVQRYWIKPNGKFLKAKRETLMDEVAKRSKSTPGPGAYKKENSRPRSDTKGIFRYFFI